MLYKASKQANHLEPLINKHILLGLFYLPIAYVDYCYQFFFGSLTN